MVIAAAEIVPPCSRTAAREQSADADEDQQLHDHGAEQDAARGRQEGPTIAAAPQQIAGEDGQRQAERGQMDVGGCRFVPPGIGDQKSERHQLHPETPTLEVLLADANHPQHGDHLCGNDGQILDDEQHQRRR